MRKLLKKYGGGVIGPPKNNLVQHLNGVVEKNVDGIYELVDKTGKQTRPIQDGRCWNFDGESNYVGIPPLSLDIEEYLVSFELCFKTFNVDQVFIGGVNRYLIEYRSSNHGIYVNTGTSYLIFIHPFVIDKNYTIRLSYIDSRVSLEITDNDLGIIVFSETKIAIPPTVIIECIGARLDMSRAFHGSMRNIIIETDATKYNFNCEEQSGNIARSIDTSHAIGTIHGTIDGFHGIDKTRE